jgi:glutamate dehydrogenase
MQRYASKRVVTAAAKKAPSAAARGATRTQFGGARSVTSRVVGLATGKQVVGALVPSTLQGGAVRPFSSATRIARDTSAWLVDRAKLISSTRKLMPVLTARGNFVYAEAWAMELDGSGLKCYDTYFDDNFKAIEEFEKAAYAIKLEQGRGAVGRVYESKEPELLVDLNFKGRARINGSEGAGLQSGLVMPLLSDNGEVVSVLHFYSQERLENDPRLSQDFLSLGRQMLMAESDKSVRPVLIETPETRDSKMMTQQQMNSVYERMREIGTFHASLVLESVDWFYNHLGLPSSYFDRYTPMEIAKHISAYTSARSLNKSTIRITIPEGNDDGYVAMCTTAKTESSFDNIRRMESMIDGMRTQTKESKKCLSASRFISTGLAVPYDSKQHRLAIYMVDVEDYINPNADPMEETLENITSPQFLERSQDILDRYQDIITRKQQRLRPYLRRFPNDKDGTIPIVIGIRSVTTADSAGSKPKRKQNLATMLGGDRGMNTIITEMLGPDLTARRKYMNTLSNGLVFFNLYLEPDSSEELIQNFLDRISLMTILPRSDLLDLLIDRTLTAKEYAYAIGASNFVYYFLSTESEDMALLRQSLTGDAENSGRLDRISANLSREALSQSRIDDTIRDYPDLVKEIFSDFDASHNPDGKREKPEYNNKLASRIDKEVFDDFDRKILKGFLNFNAHLEKTNFYKWKKSSLSYRISPAFMADNAMYPEVPYGILMMMSNEYRGFHVRFREVARGGLRLIPSRDMAAYTANRESLFTEAYNLAFTQNKKNKDIPEFGSKGTILLEQKSQSSGNTAFCKYISGMFDIMLPTKEVVDHHGKEELIFCGPDEGTADVMEWAALYGKERGYKYWKAFTTGKPASMGGIPHDTYGMTTRSVHEYVVGTLGKLGLDELEVTKMQTGGPDGDLGSNEILFSKDKTIGIVDGSGVLMDPDGIDREEMTRLAHTRSMVEEFDRSKLGDKGAVVLITDTDVHLPNGDLVDNGLTFRNNFHMTKHAQADLFVPCGGRPAAINAGNVHELFDENGSCLYKYIIEGANLFITEDARMTLEQNGVVLFKDASTNKGGVTSSSMEVLAALCMTDEEHAELMQVKGEVIPEFYKEYVHEVTQIIEENARLEFGCIWDEHERTGTRRALLTDELSMKINDLNVNVQNSSLWDNKEIRLKVLAKAFPSTLINKFGLETLLERLPEDYVRSVFGYYVASRYVYKYGMSGQEFAFFEYMSEYGSH